MEGRDETPHSTDTTGNNNNVIPPPHSGPPCPFYGFVGSDDRFFESGGNTCAFTVEHRLCKMAMSDEKPDWDKCRHYNHIGYTDRIVQIMECVNVSPKVFRPARVVIWEGISIKVWFKYVMGRDYQ